MNLVQWQQRFNSKFSFVDGRMIVLLLRIGLLSLQLPIVAILIGLSLFGCASEYREYPIVAEYPSYYTKVPQHYPKGKPDKGKKKKRVEPKKIDKEISTTTDAKNMSTEDKVESKIDTVERKTDKKAKSTTSKEKTQETQKASAEKMKMKSNISVVKQQSLMRKDNMSDTKIKTSAEGTQLDDLLIVAKKKSMVQQSPGLDETQEEEFEAGSKIQQSQFGGTPVANTKKLAQPQQIPVKLPPGIPTEFSDDGIQMTPAKIGYNDGGGERTIRVENKGKEKLMYYVLFTNARLYTATPPSGKLAEDEKMELIIRRRAGAARKDVIYFVTLPFEEGDMDKIFTENIDKSCQYPIECFIE